MLADAKPADVLKRYGVTYVVCSVALSLCSFSLFYALVASGVIDVTALLGSIGVTLRGRSERAGAVGLAYAMHKMASPIRFPPTVALTAVVARRRARSGKKPARYSIGIPGSSRIPCLLYTSPSPRD